MDQFWQAFLGLSQPALPVGFHTEHFSNEELQTLCKSFSGGNTLSDPESLGELAEFLYIFKDYDEFAAHPRIVRMQRDGLGRFLTTAWEMICKKKAK